MKREGFVLVYVDPTEGYSLDTGVICSGQSIKSLKEVVAHFERKTVKWSNLREDVFGRSVVQGDVVEDDVDFYDAPMYFILQVKPPKEWKLVG